MEEFPPVVTSEVSRGVFQSQTLTNELFMSPYLNKFTIYDLRITKTKRLLLFYINNPKVRYKELSFKYHV